MRRGRDIELRSGDRPNTILSIGIPTYTHTNQHTNTHTHTNTHQHTEAWPGIYYTINENL